MSRRSVPCSRCRVVYTTHGVCERCYGSGAESLPPEDRFADIRAAARTVTTPETRRARAELLTLDADAVSDALGMPRADRRAAGVIGTYTAEVETSFTVDMRPRMYLAGGSPEAAMVAVFIRRLTDSGLVVVTHDWTVGVLACQAAGVLDSQLGTEAGEYAHADMVGVAKADTLWLLAPAAKSEGAWFEMGYALGRGRSVIVSGPTSNIFRTAATLCFPTHEEAFAWITSGAAKRAGKAA